MALKQGRPKLYAYNCKRQTYAYLGDSKSLELHLGQFISLLAAAAAATLSFCSSYLSCCEFAIVFVGIILGFYIYSYTVECCYL